MSSLLIQMVNFCGQNMISFVQEKAMMFLFLMILFLCGQELKINTVQKKLQYQQQQTIHRWQISDHLKKWPRLSKHGMTD